MKSNQPLTHENEKQCRLLLALLTKPGRTATSHVFNSYLDLLKAYGRQFNDPDLVEDCIQEVFIDLLHIHDQLDNIQHKDRYLRRCLRNKIIKSLKRDTLEIAESRLSVREFASCGIADLPAHKTIAAFSEATYNHLYKVFDSLSTKERKAIELRFFKGQRFHQIARALNTTSHYATLLVHRTLGKMNTRIMELRQISHEN